MEDKRTSRIPDAMPWIMAAAALILYLLTLNHWVTLSSLSQPPYASNSLAEVSRVCGWTWQPALSEPVYWLITYPLHWLPPRVVPIALNLLSAICATAALWQLARSVSILPHNRTEDQRARERSPHHLLSTRTAWVAPAISVLVLGLQLSFWEHATVGSAEMLKLLLFAYVIRCLLEYRLDPRPAWLYKASFVFAAAMTTSWGMFGYLPLFLAALIWLRRSSFFNLTFLSRVAVCALAGLLFYLLLPTLALLSSSTEITFWDALKYNLGSQKGLLSAITFNKQSLFLGSSPLWVLGIPTLLPLLIMSIRWPSYFGDPSQIGVSLANLTFRFFHAVLFVICLWVMLDPQFSPRHLVPYTPLLSLYYLCALGIGYFAGYFLLVFGVKPGKRARPGLPSIPAIDYTVLSVTWALIVLTPAALVYRNLPIITAVNGPVGDKRLSAARQYAEASIVGLPSGGGILLSDDVRRLTLVRAALAARGSDDKYLFVDTRLLRLPNYHAFLERTHPDRWKNYVPKEVQSEISGLPLTQVLYQIAQSNAVYYLHPSFGYYFEAFWPEPQGLVYKLVSYPANILLAPPLSKQTIKYNEEFWARADENAVGRLVRQVQALREDGPETPVDKLLARLHLKHQQNWDLAILGSFYSRARNYWGVEAQKAEGYKLGEPHFNRALEINPDNSVARINLAWNHQAQTGEKPSEALSSHIENIYEKYRSWDSFVSENGPFDTPRFCFEQGRLYVDSKLLRQAANQFHRTTQLDPSHLAGRLWLAQVSIMTQHPDKALELIQEVRADPTTYRMDATNLLELVSIQTSALLSKEQPDKAETVLREAVKQQPNNPVILAVGTQMFMNSGHFTNALRLLDLELTRNPKNANALINKGYILLEMKRFEEAIPALTGAMNLETNRASDLYQSALFNRAIASLQAGKLEQARQDYEALQKDYPTAFKIFFGLAEIAYRTKDTNTALLNYEQYLANAPSNTPERVFVQQRIDELQGRAVAAHTNGPPGQ